MSFLEARQITKQYFQNGASLPVLRGIDLTLERGEVLFILGPSGAGKSTLLHILGSLETPTAGALFYEGKNLLEKTEPELARFRNETIGFVFQFHYLLADFTAEENVMIPLLIRGSGRREAKRQAITLLTELGLATRGRHRPAELSGGERQRVAVARALVMRPKILFADEPTGNLDRGTGEGLLEGLLDFHQEQKAALVIVTHNEGLLERAGRRGSVRSVRLADGKIQA